MLNKIVKIQVQLVTGIPALPTVKVELLSLLLAFRWPSIIEMPLLRVLVTGVSYCTTFPGHIPTS